MHFYLSSSFRYFCLLLALLVLGSYSNLISAKVVEDVVVKEQDRGYSLELQFSIPFRYQSYSPDGFGSTFEIQLRPEAVADTQLTEIISGRSHLNWNKNISIPIKEIIFDGDIVEAPALIIRFSKKVKFTVKNRADLRAIIVDIETTKPKREDNLITAKYNYDPVLEALLDRANQAMLSKQYSKAIQLYTKILTEYGGDLRERAQELLGLAREYNGQLAHAKAEYEKYLKEFPNSEGATRVKQRLIALITAADKPKDRLKKGRLKKDKAWDTQFYGSFSQTYFRDETTPEDEDSLLIRSELVNDLDFVGRARKGDYDLKLQFVGSYREELEADDGESEFIPSIFSVEAKHGGIGLYARLGRQSRTTGGVLGRFDGIHLAYDLSSIFTLNSVFGYPVDISDREKINSDQEFYGLSIDINPEWKGWNFNSFHIKQLHFDIVDREAIGGEVRYFVPGRSFFSLVDYDIFYNELNIFLMILNISITDKTTLNWIMDFRNSPLLTTTNALQGQSADTLEELSTQFSEDELNQLARDRTADSKSLTIGLTHQLNKKWQYINELTATEFGDTKASAGVEAIPGTGIEYFYSTQLIANSLFYENDSMILGLRYSDTLNSNTYSFNSSWRVNASNKLRLNPRIRTDYRKDKVDDDTRWLVRPFFRVDYRLKRSMKIECDLGYEWLKEEFAGEPETTTGYFFSIGYRAQF